MNSRALEKIIIRTEQSMDFRKIAELISLSFGNEDTLLLVRMLRSRKEFVTDFSIVAELNGEIVGYILLSPVQLQGNEQMSKSLWLEPVCVLPSFQGKGIGAALIRKSLDRARVFGFESVFLTGSYEYYCRFGFNPAYQYGINSSLYVPPEVFLCIELKRNSLNFKGKLIYPQEIFD